jgi:hypothetical protein
MCPHEELTEGIGHLDGVYAKEGRRIMVDCVACNLGAQLLPD